MLEDDERRLQRERDIAAATAPPNYAVRDGDVRAVKSENAKRAQISREQYIQERTACYMSSSAPRGADDAVLPFRANPTRSR